MSSLITFDIEIKDWEFSVLFGLKEILIEFSFSSNLELLISLIFSLLFFSSNIFCIFLNFIISAFNLLFSSSNSLYFSPSFLISSFNLLYSSSNSLYFLSSSKLLSLVLIF